MEPQRTVFYLKADGLRCVHLRGDTAGVGIYGNASEKPLGKGGFGLVRKAYRASADRSGTLQPCSMKQIWTNTGSGAKDAVQRECTLLQVAMDVPGVVNCLQEPVDTADEGLLLTEEVIQRLTCMLPVVLADDMICAGTCQGGLFVCFCSKCPLTRRSTALI